MSILLVEVIEFKLLVESFYLAFLEFSWTKYIKVIWSFHDLVEWVEGRPQEFIMNFFSRLYWIQFCYFLILYNLYIKAKW